MAFSENLRNSMRKKNITAYRVAKDNNIKQQTVKNWLDGKHPDIYLAQRVANYFGKSLDEMLTPAESDDST